MERLNNRVDHKNFLFLGEINVDGYYGYSYPSDNGFKRVEDCIWLI
jgi:hypothetical protein